MTRLRTLILTILALVLPLTASGAASLTIVKAFAAVSDGVNAANFKMLPGAALDYTITVGNPAVNGLIPIQTIQGVTIDDQLPATVKLRVADIATAGKGPVEFTDGSLLGLLGSNLTLKYTSLTDTADGVYFSSDGTNFTYQPTADAQGYDTSIKAIRIKLTGTQAAGSTFRLRFRVGVR